MNTSAATRAPAGVGETSKTAAAAARGERGEPRCPPGRRDGGDAPRGRGRDHRDRDGNHECGTRGNDDRAGHDDRGHRYHRRTVDAKVDRHDHGAHDEAGEGGRSGKRRDHDHDGERADRDHEQAHTTGDERGASARRRRATGADEHELGHEERGDEHEDRGPPSDADGEPPRERAEHAERDGQRVAEHAVARRDPRRRVGPEVLVADVVDELDRGVQHRRQERGEGEAERTRLHRRVAHDAEGARGKQHREHAGARVVRHAREGAAAPVDNVERAGRERDDPRSEERAVSGQAHDRGEEDRGLGSGGPLAREQRHAVAGDRDEHDEQHHGRHRGHGRAERDREPAARDAGREQRPGVPARAPGIARHALGREGLRFGDCDPGVHRTVTLGLARSPAASASRAIDQPIPAAVPSTAARTASDHGSRSRASGG